MQKLHRTSIEPPECLSEYSHSISKWNDLDSECKAEATKWDSFAMTIKHFLQSQYL